MANSDTVYLGPDTSPVKKTSTARPCNAQLLQPSGPLFSPSRRSPQACWSQPQGNCTATATRWSSIEQSWTKPRTRRTPASAPGDQGWLASHQWWCLPRWHSCHRGKRRRCLGFTLLCQAIFTGTISYSDFAWLQSYLKPIIAPLKPLQVTIKPNLKTTPSHSGSPPLQQRHCRLGWSSSDAHHLQAPQSPTLSPVRSPYAAHPDLQEALGWSSRDQKWPSEIAGHLPTHGWCSSVCIGFQSKISVLQFLNLGSTCNIKAPAACFTRALEGKPQHFYLRS